MSETAASTADTWESLRAGLPDHAGEIMTAHGGQPGSVVQDRTHGAPCPAPDYGADDHAKYA